MKKNLRLLAAALTAVMLTGCGSSKGMMNEMAWDSSAPAAASEEYLYDAGYDMAATTEEAPAEEFATETEAGGGEAKAQEIQENPQAGRKLITTMNISAETEHFDMLMSNLEKQIAELGGYIENSEQWNGSLDYYGNRINDRNASLTVRIPA